MFQLEKPQTKLENNKEHELGKKKYHLQKFAKTYSIENKKTWEDNPKTATIILPKSSKDKFGKVFQSIVFVYF